ncbi:lysozyme inhibitor LprI family protein [Rhodanobacter sp. L36]|uniref:lysozyme inhibitor LprI family protein n=1 Tax=Rhodanobacter sp. L36 TaxID=1747221 RepID=UPI00131B4732|nr:lysozyme inhibitor LprI family protein [Rhodanobacter sp. L36]
MKTAAPFAVALALVVHSVGAIATDSTRALIQRNAPRGITTTFYTCIEKTGSDAVALGACLSAEKATQDDRLNSTYKALLAKLDDKAKDKLIAAERTWLKLQDENIEFENSLYGDEDIADLAVTQRELFSICDRANKLSNYLIVANNR